MTMATENQKNNVVYSPSNKIITATTSVYTCKGPNAIELEKKKNYRSGKRIRWDSISDTNLDSPVRRRVSSIK